MQKILVETNLKTLPDTCSKCKFKMNLKENAQQTAVCTAHTKWVELSKTYVKEKNNWCYVIPNTCPLAIYDVED